MDALALVALAGLVTVLGVLFVGLRQRQRVSQRLDRLANRISGAPSLASRSPSRAVGRLEQVLEAHEARQQEDEKQQRYEQVLDALDVGVVLVDAKGEITFANSSATWFQDGRHSEAVVAQKLQDSLDAVLEGSVTEQQVAENLVLFGPPKRTLSLFAKPLFTADSISGAIAVIRDVTELEQTNTVRRDFVTNISHELRTPIGAVSLLAETLIDEQDLEVQDSLAKRLIVEAERLTNTVNDLLELSEIEHSNTSEYQPLSLHKVVASAHDRVRAAASQMGVVIEITAGDKDYLVCGDRRQLTSAVFNLFDNAVKFSDGGMISVSLRDEHGRATLAIADTGIGIPRRDLDRIFERFYRVERGRGRDRGGTGLGLAMVSHIVSNHQGHLKVNSIEGEGSTFTIELPLVSPQAI